MENKCLIENTKPEVCSLKNPLAKLIKEKRQHKNKNLGMKEASTTESAYI